MLRRAASLLRERAAWLPRRPVTAAAALVRRRPEPEARLRAVDGRGYARMARRMPPTRPDGYSTSEGEADAYGDVEEDLEPAAAAADGEEDASDGEGWEGFTLDLGAGSNVEEEEEEEDDDHEEEEK